MKSEAHKFGATVIVVGMLLVQNNPLTFAAPLRDPGQSYGALGHAFVRAHQYEKAIACFKKALAINPQDYDALQMTANCFDRLERYSDALPYCLKSRDLRPTSFWTVLHLAEEERRNGQYARAVADFNKAILIKPDSWAYSVLAFTYNLRGDTVSGLKILSQAVKVSQNGEGTCIRRAGWYAKLGRYKEALDDLTTALAANSLNSDALLKRAMTFKQAGMNAKALVDFDEILRNDDTDEIAHAYRGEFFLDQKKYAQAVADFSKSISLAPNYMLWRYSQLAKAHDQLGMHEAADKDRKMFATFSKEIGLADQHWLKGKWYAEQMANVEAVNEFTRAIRLNPRHPRAYMDRAESDDMLANRDDFIADAQQAMSVHPYAEGARWLGGHFGKDDKLRWLNKALELNPQQMRAHADRAGAYDAKGEHELAYQEYKIAGQINPSNYEVQSRLWNYLVSKGRCEEALALADRAIKRSPNTAMLYSWRGDIHENMGNHSKAIADYARISALAPGNEELHRHLASNYLKVGQNQKCLDECNKALALDKGDLRCAYIRMKADERLQRYDKVLEYFDAYLSRHPGDESASLRRASANANLGFYKKAIDDYTIVINSNLEEYNDVYRLRGDMYLQLHEYDKALADYSKAISLDPDLDWQSYKQRALLYDKLGKNELAVKDRQSAQRLVQQ